MINSDFLLQRPEDTKLFMIADFRRNKYDVLNGTNGMFYKK
jgi:hypothetical protein